MKGHRSTAIATAFPPPKTQRRDPAMHVAADHFVDERYQHARAAGADGMSDGDGSSINVYFVGIEIEFLHHSQCLHRERFVQFVEIDIFGLPSCFLPDGADGSRPAPA